MSYNREQLVKDFLSKATVVCTNMSAIVCQLSGWPNTRIIRKDEEGMTVQAKGDSGWIGL